MTDGMGFLIQLRLPVLLFLLSKLDEETFMLQPQSWPSYVKKLVYSTGTILPESLKV